MTEIIKMDGQGNVDGAPVVATTGKPAPAAAPVTPAVDLSAVLAENKRISEERDRALIQGREVRRFATQKSQEAASYRRQLEEHAKADADFSFEEPAPVGGARGSATPDDDLATDIAEIKFKQNTPDWNAVVDKQTGKTVWDEMNTILFDDTQAPDLAGRTPYLTLKNIHREVQYRRLVAAQKAGAEASAAADTQKNVLRARAAISGAPAGEGTSTIDLDDPNLTADGLLKAALEAGIFKVDPRDLPLSMRPK